MKTTIARWEWVLILALTTVGAVLRFWQFPNLGLQHFDEGIYALAGLWVVLKGGFASVGAMLAPYAPPGFPILVGWSYLGFGIDASAAMLVSVLAGIAVIVVAAGMGRRTVGAGAGVAVAALAAFSGPHVAFSRLALTDATLLLLWLLALTAGARFLEQPRIGRAIVFGVLVGLAQNVKYNGFLAGVIVVLAAGPDLVQRGENGPGLAKKLGMLCFAALLAALVYRPWFEFVNTHLGGYSKLLAHHRGYFHGLRGWPARWNVQMAQEQALSGSLGNPSFGWGMIAWPLAWVGWELVTGTIRARRSCLAWLVFGWFVAMGGVLLGRIPSLPWWLGLVGLPWLLRDVRPLVRILGMSWLILSVLTPMYHPYARLWLPLTAVGWLVLAWWMPILVETLAQRITLGRPFRPIELAFFVGLGLAVLHAYSPIAARAPCPACSSRPTDRNGISSRSCARSRPPGSRPCWCWPVPRRGSCSRRAKPRRSRLWRTSPRF